MSSSDGQWERKIITASCSACVLALFALIVLARTVWIPQGMRRERMMSCRSNRKYISEQEKLYRQNSPAHQYTTDLQKLKAPGANLRCPENGVYSVVIKNGQVKVYCSAKDHNVVAAQ